MNYLDRYLQELENSTRDDYGHNVFFYRKWATSDMIGAKVLGTWEFLSNTLTLQLNLNRLESHVNEHEKNHAKGHSEEEVRRMDLIRYSLLVDKI